jgi:MFS family permease
LLFLQAISPGLGWRIGFLLGPVLGVVILLVRRHLPESPRWRIMHGRAAEAEAEESIAAIEREVAASGRPLPPNGPQVLLPAAPGRTQGAVERREQVGQRRPVVDADVVDE